MVVIAVLVVEVFVTLLDFVEEDMSRKLPASERINHTLLALNYGAILVLLLPILIEWAGQPADIVPVYHGFWSILAAVAAVGAGFGGVRDFAASRRLARLGKASASGLMRGLSGRQALPVTGATGFIGSRLVASLPATGHQVIA